MFYLTQFDIMTLIIINLCLFSKLEVHDKVKLVPKDSPGIINLDNWI